jgi:hypothetical protein
MSVLCIDCLGYHCAGPCPNLRFAPVPRPPEPASHRLTDQQQREAAQRDAQNRRDLEARERREAAEAYEREVGKNLTVGREYLEEHRQVELDACLAKLTAERERYHAWREDQARQRRLIRRHVRQD